MFRAGPVALALVLLAASPTFAGDGNVLYLLQDSTVRPDLGNEMSVDQSDADESLIGSALQPATQRGALNKADLTIVGTGGTIELLQDNSAAYLSPVGNSAIVSVEGTATAVVLQQGDGNITEVHVSGLNARGNTEQSGNLNKAKLFVDGALAEGLIRQVGDNNEAVLNVTGSSSVTYVQTGNNLSYQSLAGTPQGVSVWSNAGTVLITQSNL